MTMLFQTMFAVSAQAGTRLAPGEVAAFLLMVSILSEKKSFADTGFFDDEIPRMGSMPPSHLMFLASNKRDVARHHYKVVPHRAVRLAARFQRIKRELFTMCQLLNMISRESDDCPRVEYYFDGPLLMWLLRVCHEMNLPRLNEKANEGPESYALDIFSHESFRDEIKRKLAAGVELGDVLQRAQDRYEALSVQVFQALGGSFPQ